MPLWIPILLTLSGVPTRSPIPTRAPAEDIVADPFVQNQINAERSAPVPSNPLWVTRGMTMDAVNELEEGFLDFYDERTLRFLTSYAGYNAEATYLFNSGHLAMVTISLRIGKVTPWDNYLACQEVVKFTRELAGQNENTTETFPWRYTFENNLEVHGLNHALSHANHRSEWLLDEGVLTVYDSKVGMSTYAEVSFIPRKPQGGLQSQPTLGEERQ